MLSLDTSTSVTRLSRRYYVSSASQKPAFLHPFICSLTPSRRLRAAGFLHKRFASLTLTPTVCRAPGPSVSRESRRLRN